MSLAGQCYYSLCNTTGGHVLARSFVRSIRKLGLARKAFTPFDALELNRPALRGLIQLWKRIHWSPGDGMMPVEQLLAIYDHVLRWPIDGDVVELGSWTGLTTCYLATACQQRDAGHVYAVDTFEGTMEYGQTYPSVAGFGGSTYAEFSKRIEQAGHQDRVTPLVGRTDHWAGEYPGKPIRVLFIDADHSYEGVRDDFENWHSHVAPGGLIIFHDHHFPGVKRFIEKTLRDDPRVRHDPGLVVENVYMVTRTAE
ncbi:MAG TPA: class I SAM-dependent methyltransferase [Phycisphaerae bacterium]|nr:class I SAM-dependent methyltransferase [Phycisphaerae bacterium]